MSPLHVRGAVFAVASGAAVLLCPPLPALRALPVQHEPADSSPRRVQLRGNGPLSLRLEDIDFEDVFKVLQHETGEAFVVAEGVGGRLSIDFDRVTLDEALSALGSLGIATSSRGAVRIVTTEVAGAPRGTTAAGADHEPVSMSLKRWSVEDLAALLGVIEVRSVHVPEGELGHASVFASDVPPDVLFAAIFDAAGLSHRNESARIVVDHRGAAPGALHRRLPEWRDPEAPRSITATPLAALRLMGLSGSGREWTAWVYTDDRRICWPLASGQWLQDGEITRVEADHVLFEGERGGSPFEAPERFRARLFLPARDPERR